MSQYSGGGLSRRGVLQLDAGLPRELQAEPVERREEHARGCLATLELRCKSFVEADEQDLLALSREAVRVTHREHRLAGSGRTFDHHLRVLVEARERALLVGRQPLDLLGLLVDHLRQRHASLDRRGQDAPQLEDRLAAGARDLVLARREGDQAQQRRLEVAHFGAVDHERPLAVAAEVLILQHRRFGEHHAACERPRGDGGDRAALQAPAQRVHPVAGLPERVVDHLAPVAAVARPVTVVDFDAAALDLEADQPVIGVREQEVDLAVVAPAVVALGQPDGWHHRPAAVELLAQRVTDPALRRAVEFVPQHRWRIDLSHA